MIRPAFSLPDLVPDELTLQVYLLGTVDFEAALQFQRHLRERVRDDRSRAALFLCEYPPLITVGRQGSHEHIHFEPEELRARRWPVRWINRGGGCLLHLPGQLQMHAILPLDSLGLGVQDYLEKLQKVIVALLDDFSVIGETRTDDAGVWVGDRLIAAVGVAVRDWVSYYGASLNIEPDLLPYRRLRVSATHEGTMTSLARERHGPVRGSLVRQRLVEHFCAEFGFSDPAIFSSHPLLAPDKVRRVAALA
jgi:lipoyl(octanoyl) transferase